MTGHKQRVLEEVSRERIRQEVLKAQGRFKYTCADSAMSDFEKNAVLGEEVGEVARALLEKKGLANDVHKIELEKELIQVAAVAVAWVESIRQERSDVCRDPWHMHPPYTTPCPSCQKDLRSE